MNTHNATTKINTSNDVPARKVNGNLIDTNTQILHSNKEKGRIYQSAKIFYSIRPKAYDVSKPSNILVAFLLSVGSKYNNAVFTSI